MSKPAKLNWNRMSKKYSFKIHKLPSGGANKGERVSEWVKNISTRVKNMFDIVLHSLVSWAFPTAPFKNDQNGFICVFIFLQEYSFITEILTCSTKRTFI